MFKRGIFLVLTFIFLLLAQQARSFAFESKNVKDSLNYLSSNQVTEIQTLIEKTVAAYNLDMVVVLTDDTQGKSSRDYADDYYDSHGYGVGSDRSGLLMLINMKEREVWISTTGKAIDIFTDSRIAQMVDSITGFLSEKNYYGASTEFVNQVAYYATQGVPAGQYRNPIETPGPSTPGSYGTPETYMDRVIRQLKSIWVYIIPLVIAIIATIIPSLSHKGKVTINDLTYEEKDSFQLSDSKDDFLRESTTMVKIQNNNSGGSGGMGSSTHTGSSGTTHGGGGGRF